MAFLYPVALYGLFFNLIPIIIHLMNLQRSKKVLFSNVRFLSTIQKKTSRSYQVRRWLVLLSRIFVITFLVVAFAKPVILDDQHINGQQSQKIIYLDNSFSMESGFGERTSLDVGIAAIETLLKSNQENTDVLLLTDDRLGQSRFQKSPDVLEKLPTIELTNSKQKLTSVINATNRIRHRNSGSGGKAELFLISDFQKNNLDEALKGLEVDSSLSVNLLPIVSDNSPNLYIDSLWFDVPFVSRGEQALIHVKVSNGGTEAAEEVIMRLFLSEIQKSSVTVSLAPGQTKIINLNFTADSDGQQLGRIQLDDYPITFDNDFYFTFYVSANVNVVSITEEGEEPYVTKAFANEQMFTQKGFISNSVSYDAAQSSDLLVLQNSLLADESSQSMVSKQLLAGKHVLLFPSQLAKGEDLVSLFQDAQLDKVRIERFNLKDSTLVKMKSPEQRHPFFANVFENFDSKMSTPLIRPIWNVTGDVDKILTTVNGDAALVKIENKQGGVLYLCTAPLNSRLNTFQKHSLFIPVLYRIAMESASGNDQLYVNVGQEALLSIDSSSSNKTYSLRMGDYQVVPEQKLRSGKLALSIQGSDIQAGFYEVIANEIEKSTIAVNVNPLESDLKVLTKADLQSVFDGFPNVKILEIDDDKALKSLLSNSVGHTPLWKYSLILSLMFLLVETAFIRFLK